jgi:sulfite exporter TauE/SafE
MLKVPAMNRGHQQPVRLELPHQQGRGWTYILLGAILGALFEVAVCEPLDHLLQNYFD